jgi:hypothetical protein
MEQKAYSSTLYDEALKMRRDSMSDIDIKAKLREAGLNPYQVDALIIDLDKVSKPRRQFNSDFSEQLLYLGGGIGIIAFTIVLFWLTNRLYWFIGVFGIFLILMALGKLTGRRE